MSTENRSFKLCGYVPNDAHVGFGIPIFQQVGSGDALYFQDVDDRTETLIAGFSRVVGYNPHCIKKIAPGTKGSKFESLHAGDAAVFMFASPSHIFFDTKYGLYSILAALIDRREITQDYLIDDINQDFFKDFDATEALPISPEVARILAEPAPAGDRVVGQLEYAEDFAAEAETQS